MTDLRRTLTIRQVCNRLDCSERTFRRLIASGAFPQPIRINQRRVRIPEEDVRAYLTKLMDQRQVQEA